MSKFALYPSLKGRTVLVTGGATGIGASIVEHFAAQAARVGFLDLDAANAGKLVKTIVGAGHPPPLFLPCDLRDIAALRQAIGEVEKQLGAITALVNNAARDDRHSIEAVTPDYWDERIAVNLRHQFFAAQAVLPGMKAAGGGAIVNMGSVSWMLKNSGMPAYLTAKSGVAGLTRALAKDLGPHGIRVNSVLPGWVMTERQMQLWLTPEGEREMMAGQCLKEKLYPPDIARMVLWLAADDSRMVTGQGFIVDAGWT